VLWGETESTFSNSLCGECGVGCGVAVCCVCCGMRLSPLGTPPTGGPIVPAPDYDDDQCGSVCGMIQGRGNRSTRKDPTPLTLCPP
jgi:hypothetical protein